MVGSAYVAWVPCLPSDRGPELRFRDDLCVRVTCLDGQGEVCTTSTTFALNSSLFEHLREKTPNSVSVHSFLL